MSNTATANTSLVIKDASGTNQTISEITTIDSYQAASIALQDRWATGTLTAVNAASVAAPTAGSTVDIDVSGCSTALVTLVGTVNEVITFKGIADDQVTAYSLLAWLLASGAPSGVPVSTATISGSPAAEVQYIIPCAGLNKLRIECTTFTSGSCTITIRASAGTNITHVSPATKSTAANLSATTMPFGGISTPPGNWSVTNTATAGTPSASKTAGAAGVRHVCTSVSISIAGDGTNANTGAQVNLRDGATAAGTILASWFLTVAGTASQTVVAAGLNIVGTAATAMTLEFTGATATGSKANVTLAGYSTI